MDINERQKIMNSVSDKFVILTHVNNDNKKRNDYYEFLHLNCNKKFTANFYDVKRSIMKNGGGCPLCAKEKRKVNLNKRIDKNDFQNYINSLEKDNDYTVEAIYYDNISKRSVAELTHKFCGRTFKQRVNDFKNGYRCPLCSMDMKESKLSSVVRNVLEKNGILYKTEVIVPLERDTKRYLKNDFSFNNMVIEIDGEQHFRQKKNREKLEVIRSRDLSKDEYFYNNRDNIHYMRVPYTELANAEKIVELFINKSFNELRYYRVMIISEKTIFNYENEHYYNINKTKSSRRKLS